MRKAAPKAVTAGTKIEPLSEERKKKANAKFNELLPFSDLVTSGFVKHKDVEDSQLFVADRNATRAAVTFHRLQQLHELLLSQLGALKVLQAELDITFHCLNLPDLNKGGGARPVLPPLNSLQDAGRGGASRGSGGSRQSSSSGLGGKRSVGLGGGLRGPPGTSGPFPASGQSAGGRPGVYSGQENELASADLHRQFCEHLNKTFFLQVRLPSQLSSSKRRTGCQPIAVVSSVPTVAIPARDPRGLVASRPIRDVANVADDSEYFQALSQPSGFSAQRPPPSRSSGGSRDGGPLQIVRGKAQRNLPVTPELCPGGQRVLHSLAIDGMLDTALFFLFRFQDVAVPSVVPQAHLMDSRPPHLRIAGPLSFAQTASGPFRPAPAGDSPQQQQQQQEREEADSPPRTNYSPPQKSLLKKQQHGGQRPLPLPGPLMSSAVGEEDGVIFSQPTTDQGHDIPAPPPLVRPVLVLGAGNGTPSGLEVNAEVRRRMRLAAVEGRASGCGVQGETIEFPPPSAKGGDEGVGQTVDTDRTEAHVDEREREKDRDRELYERRMYDDGEDITEEEAHVAEKAVATTYYSRRRLQEEGNPEDPETTGLRHQEAGFRRILDALRETAGASGGAGDGAGVRASVVLPAERLYSRRKVAHLRQVTMVMAAQQRQQQQQQSGPTDPDSARRRMSMQATRRFSVERAELGGEGGGGQRSSMQKGASGSSATATATGAGGPVALDLGSGISEEVLAEGPEGKEGNQQQQQENQEGRQKGVGVNPNRKGEEGTLGIARDFKIEKAIDPLRLSRQISFGSDSLIPYTFLVLPSLWIPKSLFAEALEPLKSHKASTLVPLNPHKPLPERVAQPVVKEAAMKAHQGPPSLIRRSNSFANDLSLGPPEPVKKKEQAGATSAAAAVITPRSKVPPRGDSNAQSSSSTSSGANPVRVAGEHLRDIRAVLRAVAQTGQVHSACALEILVKGLVSSLDSELTAHQGYISQLEALIEAWGISDTSFEALRNEQAKYKRETEELKTQLLTQQRLSLETAMELKEKIRDLEGQVAILTPDGMSTQALIQTMRELSSLLDTLEKETDSQQKLMSDVGLCAKAFVTCRSGDPGKVRAPGRVILLKSGEVEYRPCDVAAVSSQVEGICFFDKEAKSAPKFRLGAVRHLWLKFGNRNCKSVPMDEIGNKVPTLIVQKLKRDLAEASALQAAASASAGAGGTTEGAPSSTGVSSLQSKGADGGVSSFHDFLLDQMGEEDGSLSRGERRLFRLYLRLSEGMEPQIPGQRHSVKQLPTRLRILARFLGFCDLPEILPSPFLTFFCRLQERIQQMISKETGDTDPDLGMNYLSARQALNAADELLPNLSLAARRELVLRLAARCEFSFERDTRNLEGPELEAALRDRRHLPQGPLFQYTQDDPEAEPEKPTFNELRPNLRPFIFVKCVLRERLEAGDNVSGSITFKRSPPSPFGGLTAAAAASAPNDEAPLAIPPPQFSISLTEIVNKIETTVAEGSEVIGFSRFVEGLAEAGVPLEKEKFAPFLDRAGRGRLSAKDSLRELSLDVLKRADTAEVSGWDLLEALLDGFVEQCRENLGGALMHFQEMVEAMNARAVTKSSKSAKEKSKEKEKGGGEATAAEAASRTPKGGPGASPSASSKDREKDKDKQEAEKEKDKPWPLRGSFSWTEMKTLLGWIDPTLSEKDMRQFFRTAWTISNSLTKYRGVVPLGDEDEDEVAQQAAEKEERDAQGVPVREFGGDVISAPVFAAAALQLWPDGLPPSMRLRGNSGGEFPGSGLLDGGAGGGKQDDGGKKKGKKKKK